MEHNNIFIKGILILFGVLLAITFIEILFRVFPAAFPAEQLYFESPWQISLSNNLDYVLFDEDPNLIFKLKPGATIEGNYNNGTYTVNTISLGFDNIGFRDDGLNYSEPFIVALGDSITFGWGVEMNKTYPELLEEMLGKDVVNMGVPAQGPIQYTQILKNYGLNLRPKVVLYGFNGDNDIAGCNEYVLRKGSINHTFNRTYKEKFKNHYYWRTGRIKSFLYNNSISYVFLKFLIMKSFKADFCNSFPEEVVKATTNNTWVGRDFGFSGNYFLSALPTKKEEVEGSYSDPPYRKIYTIFGDDKGVLGDTLYNKEEWVGCKDFGLNIHGIYDFDYGTVLAKETIIEAKELSDEADAEFIVIMLPPLYDSKETYAEEKQKFNEEIKTFCQKEGIRVIDLTPIFREQILNGEELYIQDDPHFNKKGHILTAQTIYDYIKDNRLDEAAVLN